MNDDDLIVLKVQLDRIETQQQDLRDKLDMLLPIAEAFAGFGKMIESGQDSGLKMLGSMSK